MCGWQVFKHQASRTKLRIQYHKSEIRLGRNSRFAKSILAFDVMSPQRYRFVRSSCCCDFQCLGHRNHKFHKSVLWTRHAPGNDRSRSFCFSFMKNRFGATCVGKCINCQAHVVVLFFCPMTRFLSLCNPTRFVIFVFSSSQQHQGLIEGGNKHRSLFSALFYA